MPRFRAGFLMIALVPVAGAAAALGAWLLLGGSGPAAAGSFRIVAFRPPQPAPAPQPAQ